jgi:hypothetical protein
VALHALELLPWNPNDEPYFYQLQAQSTRKLTRAHYAVIIKKFVTFKTDEKYL